MKNAKLETELLMSMVKFRAYELREIDDPRIVFKSIDKATKTMLKLKMEGRKPKPSSEIARSKPLSWFCPIRGGELLSR